MAKGYLAIVLHAHLPFVRHLEYADPLEENWFFEAVTEVYIPLLLALEELLESGVDFRLHISLSPTLLSMLQDDLLLSRYVRRLEDLILLAEKEMVRTRRSRPFASLARMYRDRFRATREAFVTRYRRNLIEPFRRLQESGSVEILASAATHGFLPLLSATPAAVRAQVRVGVEYYRRTFRRAPGGFWLPECGYERGVDEPLHEQNIRYVILETHGVTHARPRPQYGVYAPICSPSGLTVFGRDPESSKQVWSSVEGYPGDFDYREFYRDIGYDLDPESLRPLTRPDGVRFDTGIKYYRVTGKHDRKEVYIPERARRKALLHARNFLASREKQVEALSSLMDRKPLILAPYDAELFGHWWFEGPGWLVALLRNCSRQKSVRLTTLTEYLEEYPLHQTSRPSPSTWGNRGFSEVWLNGKNDWIYPHLHRGTNRLGRVVRRHPHARGLARRALQQAGRELLLAQASDWAFMITSGSTASYATARTKTHVRNLERLLDEIEAGKINKASLAETERRMNIFPEIDYNFFL